MTAPVPRPTVAEQAEAEDALRSQRHARWTLHAGRGLVWLGLIALVIAVLHAGLGRAFIPGWWRAW